MSFFQLPLSDLSATKENPLELNSEFLAFFHIVLLGNESFVLGRLIILKLSLDVHDIEYD